MPDMLRELWELLDDAPPLAPGELVRLHVEADWLHYALAAVDDPTIEHEPGALALGLRCLDLVERRLVGKPLDRDELAELIDALDRRRRDGAPEWFEARTHTLDLLYWLAESTEPAEAPPSDRRRRQLAAYGLLTAAVLSPGTLALGPGDP